VDIGYESASVLTTVTSQQEVMYDWTAELTGSGDRSEIIDY